MNRCWHWLAARRAAQLAERLRPHLPADGGVLDLGSGTGHNAAALRTNCGIDVTEADIVDIHVVGKGPILLTGASLPFANGQFAATLLIFVLHYPADPLQLLAEAQRVTAGRVLVIQSTFRGRLGLSLLRLREFLLGQLAFRLARATRFIAPVPCPLHPRHFWTRKSLLATGRAAGLTLQSVHSESSVTRPSRETWLSRDLYVWDTHGTP